MKQLKLTDKYSLHEISVCIQRLLHMAESLPRSRPETLEAIAARISLNTELELVRVCLNQLTDIGIYRYNKDESYYVPSEIK